jgi:phytoene synthase
MREAWSQNDWRNLEQATARAVLESSSPETAYSALARRARHVLQSFSTSFFVVTRFLPVEKRRDVELVYAAVRYPDEVVDTFPIATDAKRRMLSNWRARYRQALKTGSIQECVKADIPCFAAGFADVVRRHGIPPEHYEAFLDAMVMDIAPRPFQSMDDLIDSYIYGSAIVVGYFLAYVYGTGESGDFARTLKASRDLGIALQLTNFLRDVREDERRGRVYLPQDLLQQAALDHPEFGDTRQLASLNTVLASMTRTAEQHYARAEDNLDTFAADSRVAIQACIDVYRQLNARIGRSPEGVLHRESVPFRDKLRVLPTSKYWRLPMAFAGRI